MKKYVVYIPSMREYETRGFDTDSKDVIFLLKSNLIDLAELQRHFQSVLPRAAQPDIIPSEFQQYFQDLLHRLTQE